MVLEDVSRMERLLTGVREISRIDSGGEESGGGTSAVGEGTPDVRQIVERVLQAFRLRATAPGFATLSGEPAPVRQCRRQRALQMVENLVDNAAGFSPEGGCVLVEVGTDGPFTLLRVSDEGPGLPEEHAGRIFDRFFSFRPGEDKGAHAGLGLAIVKSIAESCGGSVRAFNLPAGGACFEVRVPPSYSRR